MSTVVGSIEGYDVIYVEGKNVIFCKNTALPYPLIKRIIRGSTCRETIAEKNLTVTQDGSIIQLGCLTTTRENCEAIIKEVNKIINQLSNGKEHHPARDHRCNCAES